MLLSYPGVLHGSCCAKYAADFFDVPFLLQTGVFFAQALQFLVEMFVVDLRLLALCAMVLPDPSMSRIFVNSKVTGCLGNRLLRLDRQFYRALFKVGADTTSAALYSSHTPLKLNDCSCLHVSGRV